MWLMGFCIIIDFLQWLLTTLKWPVGQCFNVGISNMGFSHHHQSGRTDRVLFLCMDPLLLSLHKLQLGSATVNVENNGKLWVSAQLQSLQATFCLLVTQNNDYGLNLAT